MKLLEAAVVTAIVALTLGLLGAAFGSQLAQDHPDYPPCATEDAAGPCYWDASTQGNGIGESFIVTADQEVEYLP